MMGRCSVSILLILELPLKRFLLLCANTAYYRFNPSYSGITSQTLYLPNPHFTEIRFQSFLFWNYLSNLRLPSLEKRNNEVSILLILELPLKHFYRWWSDNPAEEFQSFLFWNYLSNYDRKQAAAEARWSFNPSYSGITSQTTIRAGNWWKVGEFQSFLFWNYLSNSGIISAL